MRWLAAAIAMGWTPSAQAHLSRPTNREPEPLQYDEMDAVLAYSPTGSRFQIHYVLTGRNGIGTENTDGDAVVDRVERIAAHYEAALDVFTSTLAFDPPPSDGDEWVDVYVLDTGVIPGGRLVESCPADRPTSCWSFIVHPLAADDDELFAKRAVFRAILSGYRTYFDNSFEVGSAAWASGDESLSAAYLTATELALGDSTVSEDGGIALFLRFLEAPDVVRETWIDIAAASLRPDWRTLLDARLMSNGTSLADEFNAFALANVEGASVADPPLEPFSFPPLSARYLAPEIELEGDGLTQSLQGGVRIAVNATLAPIEAERRGCTCIRERGSLTPLLLGLLLRVARRRPTSPRS